MLLHAVLLRNLLFMAASGCFDFGEWDGKETFPFPGCDFDNIPAENDDDGVSSDPSTGDEECWALLQASHQLSSSASSSGLPSQRESCPSSPVFSRSEPPSTPTSQVPSRPLSRFNKSQLSLKERQRLASAKYRAKGRDALQSLKGRVSQLEDDNARLTRLNRQLVSALKGQLQRHNKRDRF